MLLTINTYIVLCSPSVGKNIRGFLTDLEGRSFPSLQELKSFLKENNVKNAEIARIEDCMDDINNNESLDFLKNKFATFVHVIY